MTVRGKAFTAQRYRIEINGHPFIIAKGASLHSRWYVLTEAGKYLTSGTKGRTNYQEAVEDAREIARQRDAVSV